MKTSVDKQTAAAARQVALGWVGRALMGGTRAMREEGKRLLPQFEGESDENYKSRLHSSWLFNGYRKTVKDLSGRVFERPVEVSKGPASLVEWAANIDLAGRDLSVFAREVFEAALSGCGVTYILADAPRREGQVTRAQAAAANLRPYLVHVAPEQVLGWKTEQRGGATVLSQFRFMTSVEDEDAEDEFAEKWVDEIRVIDLVAGGVRQRRYRKGKGGSWGMVPEEDGGDYIVAGLPEITVTPVYLNRAGFFLGEPLLEDLADINVAHWQSQSDQRVILHFARVPLLFAAGLDADEKLVVSAGAATVSSNEGARLEWVEHTGAAIGAGRQDLKDLEWQMEAHGLQLVATQASNQSATGEAIDAKKETSVLAMAADALRDALERALAHMLLFSGESGEIEVSVNDDFDAGSLSIQELTQLLAAVNSGKLSRFTFLQEMARRGVIRGDVDPGEEIDRIEAEGASSLEGEPLSLG